ncbi:MAG TPA: MATE family efflux transporter, partial [Ruminiclostridium sp.]|nr:MATE family efflux transporter [Ruminiclostridium sp.]
TFLNYVLIFGNFGAPKLGVNGTAIATTAARFIETFILLTLFVKTQKESIYKIEFKSELPNGFIKKTLIIASPIALNEFLWGFGDSMYSVVYGHIGAAAAAAMSLTSPVQNLSVGLFTGVSTAAAILVGNKLGKGEYDSAYKLSLKYMKLSVIGSIGMGGVVSIFAWVYSGLFKVPVSTRHTTVILLYIFSAYLFVKVSNMVLSGGIIRSGGKTNYTLYMDIFGTWIIGVPIGFLSAFVLHLPIEWVYSLITTEEVVRLIIGVFIFKSKKWMRQISKGTGDKNSYEAA